MPGVTVDERCREVVLSDKSDLIIQVMESSDILVDGVHHHTNYVTHFKVCQSTLAKKSRIFAFEFQAVTNEHHVLRLGNADSISLELWLCRIHDAPSGEHLYEMPIENLYHVIAMSRRYKFYDGNFEPLKGWFERWYDRNCLGCAFDFKVSLELAYPCFIFNHAAGYMKATKYLAYNSRSRVHDYNMGVYRDLRLDPNVFTAPVNSARDHLREVLRKRLWEHCEWLIDSDCTCKKETFFDYQQALVKTGVWPHGLIFPGQDIGSILQDLARFEYTAKFTDCATCSLDLKASVERLRKSVASDFDGLCLDCMQRSRSSRSTGNPDYWKECASVDGRWDDNCRLAHKRSTWVYSWMGNPQHKSQLLSDYRSSRSARQGLVEAKSRPIGQPHASSALRHRMGRSVTPSIIISEAGSERGYNQTDKRLAGDQAREQQATPLPAKSFNAVLSINDYPKEARWAVVNPQYLTPILQDTGCSITSKGSYYGPGVKPKPGAEPKLYLLVEGKTDKMVTDGWEALQKLLNSPPLPPHMLHRTRHAAPPIDASSSDTSAAHESDCLSTSRAPIQAGDNVQVKMLVEPVQIEQASIETSEHEKSEENSSQEYVNNDACFVEQEEDDDVAILAMDISKDISKDVSDPEQPDSEYEYDDEEDDGEPQDGSKDGIVEARPLPSGFRRAIPIEGYPEREDSEKFIPTRSTKGKLRKVVTSKELLPSSTPSEIVPEQRALAARAEAASTEKVNTPRSEIKDYIESIDDAYRHAAQDIMLDQNAVETSFCGQPPAIEDIPKEEDLQLEIYKSLSPKEDQASSPAKGIEFAPITVLTEGDPHDVPVPAADPSVSAVQIPLPSSGGSTTPTTIHMDSPVASPDTSAEGTGVLLSPATHDPILQLMASSFSDSGIDIDGSASSSALSGDELSSISYAEEEEEEGSMQTAAMFEPPDESEDETIATEENALPGTAENERSVVSSATSNSIPACQDANHMLELSPSEASKSPTDEPLSDPVKAAVEVPKAILEEEKTKITPPNLGEENGFGPHFLRWPIS